MRPSPSNHLTLHLQAFAFLVCLGLILTACVGWPGLPTQPSTLVPSETSIPLPDLVVVSAQIESSAERICDDPAAGLFLHVIVKNQGSAPAGAFAIDINGNRQSVTGGLAQGQEYEFKIDSVSSNVRLLLDPAGQIQESDKTNNDYSAQITFPTLPAECQPTPTPQAVTESPQFTLQGHTAAVLGVAFSPDGNLLASGSVDNTLRLWRVKEGSLLRTMQGHPFPVSVVEFSPNGAVLATGSPDGIIRTWSVSNGLLGKTLQAHAGRILDLEYSPDGKLLASSADDFTVRIWNATDGRLLKTVDEGMTLVNSLTFSPDGKTLVWAEQDGSLRVWRIADGAWLNHLHGLPQPASSIALSSDGKLLVSGYQDGRIQFWSFPDGTLLNTLTAQQGAITGLAFSPDGAWLAVSSRDPNLRLWQLNWTEKGSPAGVSTLELKPSLAREFIGHTGNINSLAFSPKGTLLASGSDDATLRIWAIPEK